MYVVPNNVFCLAYPACAIQGSCRRQLLFGRQPPSYPYSRSTDRVQRTCKDQYRNTVRCIISQQDFFIVIGSFRIQMPMDTTCCLGPDKLKTTTTRVNPRGALSNSAYCMSSFLHIKILLKTQSLNDSSSRRPTSMVKTHFFFF